MAEKKNIYKVNRKEMRKLLARFNKTVYGRIVFIIAYFTPCLMMLALLGLGIAGLIRPEVYDLSWVMAALGVLLVSFLVGTGYYYHELREFVEHSEK